MTKGKLSIHRAASALLKELDAPSGAFSTMVDLDRHGPVIRVLVDPRYRHAVQNVPESFMGYRVTVEVRPAVYAFGGRP